MQAEHIIIEKPTEIQYGSKIIPVYIIFERRNNLSITVYPDRKVTAKAPIEQPWEKVQNHLQKRAPWILKQLDYFEQFHPLPTERKYVSGETHYYLGRQYRLKIREENRFQVKLVGGYFLIDIPDSDDAEKVKRLMRVWYLEHARILLNKRIALYIDRFVKLGAVIPEVRFRRMKKRWGSCSSGSAKKVVILNTELVKAPIHCIDYVIIHELCHLIQPHHDKSFYQLLGRILPDWNERKKRLEQVYYLG